MWRLTMWSSSEGLKQQSVTTKPRESARCGLASRLIVEKAASVLVESAAWQHETTAILQIAIANTNGCENPDAGVIAFNAAPHLPPLGRQVERRYDNQIFPNRRAESAGGG